VDKADENWIFEWREDFFYGTFAEKLFDASFRQSRWFKAELNQ
jgi:hypothetical protein